MLQSALTMQGITKRFFGVTVLDKVDFSVAPGEIHGLLGENGAGKSTLMKVLNGALMPDEGKILIEGNEVHYNSPSVARHFGVGMVYQELNLFPHLTVAENIFMPHMPLNKVRLVDWEQLKNKAKEHLRDLNVELDVNERVDKLSIAQQQIIAIVRALISNCRILILDEPTSALPQRDVDNLFCIMRRLKAKGIATIFITHKLNEVLEITDRVTVLNNGRLVASLDTRDATEDLLSHLIVGKTVKEKYPKVICTPTEEILCLDHVSVKDKLNDISFELHKGEVLGIVGLLGAGKTEIAKTIFGVYGNKTAVVKGAVYLEGRRLSLRSPIQAVKDGIGFISENRGEEGLLLEHSIKMNVSLPALRFLSRRGFVNRRQENAITQDLIKKLGIKCQSPNQKVRNLSGGNQQKVVISKWLATQAKIMIFDEPTRGIDVGAKVEVYKLINEMVHQGIGVLLLSSEVPEVYGMADRILVLRKGEIVRELQRHEVSEQELQRLVM